MLVAAVMATGNPQFAGVVLERLSDRSTEVKGLAIREIAQCEFLQFPEAKPRLEKLWTMKSMAFYRADISRALEALEKTASGGPFRDGKGEPRRAGIQGQSGWDAGVPP